MKPVLAIGSESKTPRRSVRLRRPWEAPAKKSEPPPEPTRADVLGQMNAELAQAKSLSYALLASVSGAAACSCPSGKDLAGGVRCGVEAGSWRRHARGGAG